LQAAGNCSTVIKNMNQSILHTWNDHHFWLSPERCIFWEEEKALIVSDLHLGKTGHFRKAGIAVPQTLLQEDMQRLVNVIQYFQPRQLIIVGDLFHSVANKEHELFVKWRADFPGIIFRLIKGNHDILSHDWYAAAGIMVEAESWQLQQYCFCHEPLPAFEPKTKGRLEDMPGDTCFFSGHLHPGIRMRGLGKQALSLPCFYFSERLAILPAFSRFSGLALIEPRKGDRFFAIANNTVMAL
jgi:uncharacterized protein